MKKTLFFIPLAILFLSGCATYSFKKGETPYSNGFVVSRYDRVIPEYTLGKDNSVPDEQVARERFQRRRVEVESYYKKMGYIENRFKQNFVDPPIFMIQAALGIFWIPSIAIDDYKYNHDPEYKESVDKKEDAEYKAEKERIKVLKDQLKTYIQKDLEKEASSVPIGEKVVAASEAKKKTEPASEIKELAKEEALAKEAKAVSEKTAELKRVEEAPIQQEVTPEVSVPKPEEKAVSVVIPPKPEEKIATPALAKDEKPLELPVAVIIAKPVKGNSPLFVQFNGSKSHSPNGRIVSYFWDFGDGDTSTKKNPANSYWSTTYGKPRQYTVKLTVKDEKGITSDSSAIIEVLTQ